ncbi:hypothetical protein HORIV_66230 [Vreelandella olivaria]|uniref:Sarcosine oxidase subunit delta n=1 Tax=Vreelandella olivaria TaxID=390919 RepID=A0ABM7GU07_9GAMM|nr:hypothetical protein HORIV_66230 [Halomonas olivaria]
MFYIYCPYCGEHREEEEFHPKGQAHIERPKEPEACSDEEWGDYLFFRDNPVAFTMKCGCTRWVAASFSM